MKYLVFLVWILLSSCVFTAPNFQSLEDTCSTLVTSALEITDQYCGGTVPDQLCYGHSMLDIEPQPGFGPFNFNQAGDKVEVAGLQSLRVSGMNTATDQWGVALMQVQANLPGTLSVQDVTFLIMGDVEIENRVRGLNPVDVTVAARGNVNIRTSPDLDAFVSGTLQSGETVTARGRLADSSWLFVDLPEGDSTGWVFGPSMTTTEGIDNLTVVDPETAFYGPMQAFYLETGTGADPNCREAPENGLMIQTSEGVAEVSLWINEVKIRLGSTAFIRASRNDSMTVTMLEGNAHVEAQGVEFSAPAGTELKIPMDANLAPSGPPSAPSNVSDTNVQNLPPAVENLDRQIVIPTFLPPTNTPTSTNTPLPTATYTPTPTNTPLPTNTKTPTSTNTPLPTATNTPLPTSTNTPLPTNTPEPTSTNTPLPTNTLVPSSTPITVQPSDTPQPTIVPTSTPAPTDTPVPTATNTRQPTATLTPTDTQTPPPAE